MNSFFEILRKHLEILNSSGKTEDKPGRSGHYVKRRSKTFKKITHFEWKTYFKVNQ